MVIGVSESEIDVVPDMLAEGTGRWMGSDDDAGSSAIFGGAGCCGHVHKVLGRVVHASSSWRWIVAVH